MAVSDIVVLLTANTSKFQSEISHAQTKVQQLEKNGSSSLKKLGAVGKAVFLGLGGAAVAGGILAVNAADDLENAQTKLKVAFKNAGTSFDDQRAKLDKLNSRFEVFGYTNADTETALSRIVTALGSTKGAYKALGVAADIAAARGIDLNTATDLLSKTMAGNITAAKRMGIKIPEEILKIKDPAEKAAAVLKILGDRFSGQASKGAETFGGKTKAMKAQLKDAAAKIGNDLIPALTNLVTGLSKVVDWFKHNKKAAEALAYTVSVVLVAAFAVWAASVATELTGIDIELGGIPIIIGLIVVAVVYLATHWKKTWKTIKDDTKKALDWIQSHFVWFIFAGPIGWMILAVDQVAIHWKGMWTNMKRTWHSAQDNIINPVITAFHFVVDSIKADFALVDRYIVEPFKNAFRQVATMWNDTLGGLHFGGILGFGAFTIPSISTKGLASGGNLFPNRPQWVGERGPELLFPGQTGAVVRNSETAAFIASGGSKQPSETHFHATFNVHGADPQATVNALRTWIQRNGSLAGAGVA